jgi:hypothetical protein
LRPFAGVNKRFIFIFKGAVRMPGGGEGQDDQKSEDGAGDQREQGGLREGVDVVPFQVRGEAKLG